MRGLWAMFQFLHKQEMKMLKSGITGLSAWGLNSNLRRVPTKPPPFLPSLALAPLLSLPLTLPSLSLPIHTNHSSQLPSAISTSQNTLCFINALVLSNPNTTHRLTNSCLFRDSFHQNQRWGRQHKIQNRGQVCKTLLENNKVSKKGNKSVATGSSSGGPPLFGRVQ